MQVHVVHGEPDSVIFLGADSRLELFADSRQAELQASSLVEECSLIADAIIGGRVREKLRRQGNDVVESRCVIKTAKGTIKGGRYTFGSRLFRRVHEEIRIYEPYGSTITAPDAPT